MTEEEIAAKEAADAAAGEGDSKPDPNPTDPIKEALAKSKEGKEKTELEKATYKFRKLGKHIKEKLGADPLELLEEEASEIDDNAPVTVGMLKEIEINKTVETSLKLADEIQDEDEKELVKVYLQTRIIPSGNPAEDLKLARAGVNALKNAQIAEETARIQNPSNHSAATGARPKVDPVFVPTEEELKFMKPPFNMTPAEILKARPQEK